MNMSEPTDDRAWDKGRFTLFMPFWMDTGDYTDRDRKMFVCGGEFADIVRLLERGGPAERPIHRENESRTRMAAGRLKRRVQISHFTKEEDPQGTWAHLSIEA